MRSNRKDIPKQNLAKEDIISFASACQRFDEIDLQIPILSIYEAFETRLRENILLNFRPGNNSSVLVSSAASIKLCIVVTNGVGR